MINHSLIEEFSNKMAKDHAEIIDKEIRQVVEKYKVHPNKIILEIIGNTNYAIKINAGEFSIEHKFVYEA